MVSLKVGANISKALVVSCAVTEAESETIYNNLNKSNLCVGFKTGSGK